jgi:alkylated DNA repair protein alkB homolog 6
MATSPAGWDDHLLEPHRIHIPRSGPSAAKTDELGDNDEGFARSAFLVRDFLNPAQEESVAARIKGCESRFKTVRRRRVLQFGGLPHPKGMVAVPLPDWLQSLGERLRDEFDAFGDGESPNHVLLNEYSPGDGIMPHTDGPLYKPHFAIVSLVGTVVMTFYRREWDEVEGQSDGGFSSQANSDTGSVASGGASSLASSATASSAGSSSSGTSGDREILFRLILPPRSLLVVTEELYAEHLHGIDYAESDKIDELVLNREAFGYDVGDAIPRDPVRYSLTIRRVQKVLKNQFRLPGMRR